MPLPRLTHPTNATYFTRTQLSLRIHYLKMSAAPPPSRPVKLLFLHGYTQSGPLFQAKTGALRKTLQKAFPAGCECVYPTAPLRLSPADEAWLANGSTNGDSGKGVAGEEQEIDAWAWWKRKGDGGSKEGFTYEGMEVGFSTVADVLRKEGPFDGVVGFSQGGCAAGMVASLLENGRREAFLKEEENGGMTFPSSFNNVHPPLKFAVSYSGFIPLPLPQQYTAFYTPKISTPMLHFIGTQDVVVSEERSLALAKACEHNDEKYVVYHPGGHFLPSTQKASVNALIGFIKEVLHREEQGGKEKEEEKVEDMDVPF